MSKAEGKVFMFTGALSIPRWQAQNLVIEAGGIPGASVCSSTDYLVVGDRPGSKLSKAEGLGVTILTESEFRAMIESGKDIDGEDWSNIQDIVRTEDLLSALEKLMKKTSYWDSNIMEGLIIQYPDITLMPESKCPFCGQVIPYSIHTKDTVSTPKDTYYCFNCRNYSDQPSHNHCWVLTEFKGTEAEPLVLACIVCSEMRFATEPEYKEIRDHYRAKDYHNSLEMLVTKIEEEKATQMVLSYLKIKHTCTDFEVLDIPLDSGFYVKCKVCGTVKFVGTDEFVVLGDINGQSVNSTPSLPIPVDI